MACDQMSYMKSNTAGSSVPSTSMMAAALRLCASVNAMVTPSSADTHKPIDSVNTNSLSGSVDFSSFVPAP